MNCFPTYHFTDEETKAERLRHLPKAAGLRGDSEHTERSEIKKHTPASSESPTTETNPNAIKRRMDYETVVHSYTGTTPSNKKENYC